MRHSLRGLSHPLGPLHAWQLRDIRNPPTTDGDRAARLLVAGGGAGAVAKVFLPPSCALHSSLLDTSVLCLLLCHTDGSCPVRKGQAPLPGMCLECASAPNSASRQRLTARHVLGDASCGAQIEGMQRQPGAPRTSVWRMFPVILRSGGVLGFWQGNWANVVRIIPNKGIVFASQDLIKRALLKPGETHLVRAVCLREQHLCSADHVLCLSATGSQCAEWRHRGRPLCHGNLPLGLHPCVPVCVYTVAPVPVLHTQAPRPP